MTEKIGRTLEELYDTYFKDFYSFLQSTQGLLFSENCDGQLRMLFIDTFEDLSEYLDCTVSFIDESDNKLQIIVKE